MKILLEAGKELEKVDFWIEYLRDIYPELVCELNIYAISPGADINKWASEQHDIKYFCFDEGVASGHALNQIIGKLGADDILIMNSYFIPLAGSFERLLEGLRSEDNAFAVGPFSNSFNGVQHAEWKDAEEALDWSEQSEAICCEETLYLHPGVILFSKDAIIGAAPFDEEAVSVGDVILEKCVREYLDGRKMYVCSVSGFWDVRGPEFRDGISVKSDILRKRFDIHYLNVGGNETVAEMISNEFDHNERLRILEIGCDCGGTLFMLKKRFKNAILYGTDISENPIKITSKFATVKVDNIEDKKLDFGENNFDIIIFADVLEHLRDPLATIVFCKELLSNNGCIVASIPNLMNIEIMKYLLNGDFPYADYGLLDRTHIHMFTYNEIVKMFEDNAGYKIEKITMNGELSKEDDTLAEKLTVLGGAKKFMYQAYQYQILARKS